MTSFTPADLGRVLSSGPDWHAAEDLRQSLSVSLAQIDVQPRLVARSTHQTADPGAVRFPGLLTDDPDPSEIADAWEHCLESKWVSVAEGLLLDHWFSVGGVWVSRALPARLSYIKSILTIRQKTAIALHNYAREVNWRRPILFCSVLKLARTYLRHAVDQQELTRDDIRKEFTGRLGVTTVLISRFEPVEFRDALEAMAALEQSLTQGNQASSAIPYLLEAASIIYDLSGDRTALDTALALEGRTAIQDQRASHRGDSR